MMLKNKVALDFIRTHNISMTFNHIRDKRIVELQQYGLEIGHFSLDGKLDTDTVSMNIFIEDFEELRGRGLAKLMVGYLLSNMKGVRPDQLIFIDSDASAGFWEHIGMQDNPYYERGRPDLIGRGYEKKITFSKLAKWAL